MPETLERTKGYANAFDNLCTTGESKVIENALLLSNHLLPAAQIFAYCYNGNLVACLQTQQLILNDAAKANYYSPFLAWQNVETIFPRIKPDNISPPVYFAAVALIDKDGVVFGKIGWIDESLVPFDTASLTALQLAAGQFASLVTKHAAEMESRRQLRYYFDNSPLAIIEWDSSLKVSQWSSRAEELFGWKKEEVFGLTFYDFNIVHPDSQSALAELVKKALDDTIERVVIENKNFNKDGEELFCRWHNTVLREKDGKIRSVFAIVENISSLALVNKSLKKSTEKLEENTTELNRINELNKAIVSALPDLMFRVTNEGVFADYYAPGAERALLYLPPADFIGKNAADILPAPVVKLLYNAFAQIAAGEKIALYTYELRFEDEVKEFESRITRINSDEYICIVRDITEAKKAERQITYKNELLDAVAQIGSLLLSNNELANEWHRVFEKSLAIMGNSFRASRVYFLQVQAGNSLLQASANIMYEWLNEGAASQLDNAAFKNISLAKNLKFWQQLQLNKVFTAARNKLPDGYLKKLLTESQSLSVIILPLVINDELFGVIVLDDCQHERLWTMEEKATLRIISNNLITSYETNQAQNNIKKVNERFGYVMKATNDLIWDWDIENDVIERSENGFKNLTGYNYDEVKHTPGFWSERVHPDDKESMLVNFSAALNNPAVFFWENNFRFLKKDGSFSYLTDRCYIIRNTDGKAIRAIGAARNITEQRKAVMELANSEQRFRSMIYNISDVITLLDENAVILYQSASAKRILGFDDSEMLGKSFFSLVHPHDVEIVAQFCNESLMKEGDSQLIHFRYLTKGGAYLSLEAIGNNQLNNPAVNAIILLCRDVTDRLKVEEAIRASEEKFRSLVHNISDIITIISPEGKILYQSSSVKQKMGYAENELSDRSIAEIVHPEDLAELMGAVGKLVKTSGTSDPMEFRIMNKDGGYFYIEAQATNQINNPTIGGIVITSRDISQRKKTEEERKILIKELTKNNAVPTQFSYIVSHDLRAPLTNLIAMIKLLDFSTIQNSRSLKLLEGFKISTFKLRDTLNDLTDILLVKNNTNVAIKSLSFKEVFNTVQQSINSLIEKSGILISTDFTQAPGINFSEPYLESIFQNLLTNSIRYASPERQPQIKVVTKEEGANIIITFADNGIGFDMNVVKGKIFGLHQRFHHHPESRGIGLYLIHSQITSLGGSITVQSEEGTGTTFFITLKK